MVNYNLIEKLNPYTQQSFEKYIKHMLSHSTIKQVNEQFVNAEQLQNFLNANENNHIMINNKDINNDYIYVYPVVSLESLRPSQKSDTSTRMYVIHYMRDAQVYMVIPQSNFVSTFSLLNKFKENLFGKVNTNILYLFGKGINQKPLA